jgi:hypothetical protein
LDRTNNPTTEDASVLKVLLGREVLISPRNRCEIRGKTKCTATHFETQVRVPGRTRKETVVAVHYSHVQLTSCVNRICPHRAIRLLPGLSSKSQLEGKAHLSSTASSSGWTPLGRGSDGRFGLRRFRAKLTPTAFGTHRAFTHALPPSFSLRSVPFTVPPCFFPLPLK